LGIDNGSGWEDSVHMLRWRRRWAVVAPLAILLAGLLATTAVAIRGGSQSHLPRAVLAQTEQAQEPAEPEGEGVHGGPNARFHNAGACPLPSGAKLEGNWTHGDYVTAWAEADETKVRDAAHSPCGKPAHVAQKGANPGKAFGKSKRPRKPATPEPQPPRSS
jgi:hypothetical protein